MSKVCGCCLLAVLCAIFAAAGVPSGSVRWQNVGLDHNLLTVYSLYLNGDGIFEATANGDPTCLMPFKNPEMRLFSGAVTAIVRVNPAGAGSLTLEASAPGLRRASATVAVGQ